MLISRGAGEVLTTMYKGTVTINIVSECCFDDAAEEEGVSGGQEEAALFMGETAFMQGAVGLTLMPSTPTSTPPLPNLCRMGSLVLGTDKLFGFFLSVRLSLVSCCC